MGRWRTIPNPKSEDESVLVYEERSADLAELLARAPEERPSPDDTWTLWRIEAQRPLSGRRWGVRAFWRERAHIRQEKRRRTGQWAADL